MFSRPVLRQLLAATSVLLLAGCAGSPSPAATPAPSADVVAGPVNVFAAASLSAAFKEEGPAFRLRHPKANAVFNFAGSATLVTSINNGAPADVFASADQANLQKVVAAGNSGGRPSIFATNQLQVVVPAGNPKGIRGLSDLAAPGVVLVLCAPAVPCGSYALQALAKAGVRVSPKSLEQDVSAVVAKVSTGEADAGIVYATDVRAAGSRVHGIDIPSDQNVIALYPAVTLKGGVNPRGGQAFVEFLLSPAGQAILSNHGFLKA